MQEDTLIPDAHPGAVLVRDAVKPWENVRFQGEDLRIGTEVLKVGDRLTAARLGLAAALGLGMLPVRKRPKVAVLVTGDELAEPGDGCGPGQIFESNRPMIVPLLTRAGALVQRRPRVPDTLAGTKSALMSAWEENDAVVTTGGVSVGEFDFVKAALESLGGRVDLWRVAIKPGKPFAFGEWNGKLLFGLPGNPVSALVTFVLLVRPALLRWQGAREVAPVRYRVLAGEGLENRGDRRHFIRARLDESGRAWPTGGQASHLLGSLAAADGLLDVSAGRSFAAGDPLDFLPLPD